MRISFVASVLIAVTLPSAAQPVGTQELPLSPSLGPKTVVPALVACTDRPTIAVPAGALRVLAPHAADGHQTSTAGQIVVLNAGTTHGLMAGQQFFTRRLQPPANGEPMSATTPGSIRTSGWLTVVAADTHAALARIDYSCTAIEPGDYLEPYVPPALPTMIATGGRTNFADLGRVLFGLDRRESFGAGDFLSIDRGSVQGLVVGTRVAFYRDRANGTPLVEIGTGIVIEVSEDSAKVVLDRAIEDIRRGDYYGIRR
jgi:hypothetical protein